MRALIACALAAPLLSGCLFFFIPGSAIDAAVGAPKYCVRNTAQVGDTFSFDGASYRITALKGESKYYCRERSEGYKMGADAVPM